MDDDDDPVVGIDDGARASSVLETIKRWAPEMMELVGFVTHMDDFDDEKFGVVYTAIYSLTMSRATEDLFGATDQ